MPFPFTDGPHYWGLTGTAGYTGKTTVQNFTDVPITGSAQSQSPNVCSVTVASGAAVQRVFTPGLKNDTTVRDSATFLERGFAYPLNLITPTDSRGKTILPAQTITFTYTIHAVATTGETTKSHSHTAKLTLWRWKPAASTATLIATAQPGTVFTFTTPPVTLDAQTTITVPMTVPAITLERDESLLVQFGGSFGTNTTDLGGAETVNYRMLNTADGNGAVAATVAFSVRGPRRAYTESASNVGRGTASMPARRASKAFSRAGRGTGSYSPQAQRHASLQRRGARRPQRWEARDQEGDLSDRPGPGDDDQAADHHELHGDGTRHGIHDQEAQPLIRDPRRPGAPARWPDAWRASRCSARAGGAGAPSSGSSRRS